VTARREKGRAGQAGERKEYLVVLAAPRKPASLDRLVARQRRRIEDREKEEGTQYSRASEEVGGKGPIKGGVTQGGRTAVGNPQKPLQLREKSRKEDGQRWHAEETKAPPCH